MMKCTLSDVMFYSMDDRNATYVVMSLSLDHPVNKEIMSKAFTYSCKRFPYFQTKLEKLASGFKLVKNEHMPKMHTDSLDYLIDASNNDAFLYRFSVLDNHITLSVFHGLTDANGMIAFIKVILKKYYELLGEKVEIPLEYNENDVPSKEETAEPLDYIPDDITPAPYTGSTFFHIPLKKEKDITAYQFKVDADDLMQYASSSDGSPNAIAAITLAKTIQDIHPESINDGIDIGITINGKPFIGIPLSHWPFLSTSIFHFDEKRMQMDNELLNTCVRGKIIADCSEEKLFPALAGVRSLSKIFEYIKDDASRKLLCLKSTESARTTANISYAGKTDFGSISKHITGFYTCCNSCVPTLEINYNKGIFYCSLSSNGNVKEYAQKFVNTLNDMHIKCSEIEDVHFTKSRGKRNKPKFGLNLATLHLIKGISKYKKEMTSQ